MLSIMNVITLDGRFVIFLILTAALITYTHNVKTPMPITHTSVQSKLQLQTTNAQLTAQTLNDSI